LLGAKLSLFSAEDPNASCLEIVQQVVHVPLNEDPLFQETYVEEMSFPDG
jgi:uncharacterized 2Fe-2S/4Fe-4S cluster protein (DUF4445 family)